MARTQPSQNPDSVKKTARLIYIGPNIAGGLLITNQVFKGGYPSHCADLFIKLPDVKKLFVDVAKLTSAQKQLAQEGTLLYIAYHNVANAMKKKGGV